MGRPRIHRRDLPERVYFKNGAYYFVHATGKWERLDADYGKAMVRWAEIIQRPESTQATTVGELLDRYLLEVVPSKAERTQKDNRQEIRFLRSFFGGMALEDVTTATVAQYVSNRRAKTRCNREVALLSHAFNKAILWGLAVTNPCALPGIRNSEQARERYVTDEEVEKFKEVSPPWLKLYIDLKLLLGLRKQDMLSLSWQNVSQTVISVATKKTRKRMAIRVTPEVQSILDQLDKSWPTLFVTRSGRMYTSAGFNSTWKRTMVKFISTGNQRFHEHDLRGKTATDMDNSQQAKELLGHKSIKTTEGYIKARRTDVVQPHSRSKK